MRVAVVGKGGAGKSLVAGTMARLVARRGERVLALDSDPIPGLAISLGLGPLDVAMLADAAERDENGRWRLKKGIGAARAVQRYAVTAPDGVRLLQFGKASVDGLAPVMGSLNAFYAVVHRLARTGVLAKWSVVGDLPAGPRQTAFNWAPYASTFVLIVEPTWQSILTARRIARIARGQGHAEVAVVANKVASKADVALIAQRLGRDVLAVVPSDDEARNAEQRGLAPIDVAPGSPAVRAVESLVDKLWGRTLDPVRSR